MLAITREFPSFFGRLPTYFWVKPYCWISKSSNQTVGRVSIDRRGSDIYDDTYNKEAINSIRLNWLGKW